MNAKNILSASCLCLVLSACDDPDLVDPMSDAGSGEGKRARILARIDKDGDGVISPEERASAQSSRPAGSAQARPAAQGHEGDVALSPTQKKRLIQRFDADGDGTLNDEERAAVRRTMQKRRDSRAQ